MFLNSMYRRHFQNESSHGRVFVFLLCYLLLFLGISPADSAEDSLQKGERLISQAIEACGGKEAFRSIKSVKETAEFSATVKSNGQNLNLSMATVGNFLFPDRFRIDMSMGSKPLTTQIFNRDRSVLIMPNGVRMESEDITSDMKNQIWCTSIYLFSNYDRGGVTTKYSGRIEENDTVYEELLVSPKGTDSFKFYLDAKTMLPAKRYSRGLGMDGKPADIMEYLSDYRDVQAIKIPFMSIGYINGEKAVVTTTTKVELNCAIDESIFKISEEDEKKYDLSALPKRDPDAPPQTIDLTNFYNADLKGSWCPIESITDSDLRSFPNDLAELPTGIGTFENVPFDVRGIVQLNGFMMTSLGGDFPNLVEKIPVNRKFERLHALHSTSFVVEDKTVIGGIRLHYADGGKQEFQIAYGEDVRDWWARSNVPMTTSRSKVAWRGANALSRKMGVPIQLYLSSWKNPNPDKEVISLDYYSTMTKSAPFLIAITAE